MAKEELEPAQGPGAPGASVTAAVSNAGVSEVPVSPAGVGKATAHELVPSPAAAAAYQALPKERGTSPGGPRGARRRRLTVTEKGYLALGWVQDAAGKWGPPVQQEVDELPGRSTDRRRARERGWDE